MSFGWTLVIFFLILIFSNIFSYAIGHYHARSEMNEKVGRFVNKYKVRK